MTAVVKDRVVLVTGGSRGIGAAIVRACAADGMSVYFTFAQDRDAASALAADCGAAAGGIAFERSDLAEPESFAALVDRTVARFGRIDALVNNAGIYADNPFDGEDFDAWRAGWRRTFEINLFGAADLTWHALRAMREQPRDARGVRGRIINVASRAAHRGETSFADYGASKAALVNFTKSIARGCAADGIVAFSVAPGFIETDMATDALLEFGDRIRGDIPSGRVGMPDEVASIVAFLVTGGADYATGTTIDVNGASYVR